jgi:tetratricopeptide (TPR) repeat protein
MHLRSLSAFPTADVPTPSPVQPNERRRALFAAERSYDEGMALLAASEPRAAREKFEAAVDIHPREATYRVAIAQAILAGGADPDENAHALAFDFIEEALRLDPSSLPANLEAAKLLIQNGMPDAAREYLEHLLQRAPDHTVARKMLREL